MPDGDQIVSPPMLGGERVTPCEYVDEPYIAKNYNIQCDPDEDGVILYVHSFTDRHAEIPKLILYRLTARNIAAPGKCELSYFIANNPHPFRIQQYK